MDDNNQYSLKDAIKKMMSEYHLDDRLAETRMLAAWEKTMGPMIARYTDKMYINRRKLYIYITSAPLRNELSYAREKIVKRMNEAAGKEVIDEVVIR